MATLQEELAELYELKRYIESKTFQVNLVEPIKREIDNLKPAYQCESLRELATLKGRYQGLKFFMSLLKQVDTDIKNKKYEVEQGRE